MNTLRSCENRDKTHCCPHCMSKHIILLPTIPMQSNKHLENPEMYEGATSCLPDKTDRIRNIFINLLEVLYQINKIFPVSTGTDNHLIS